MSVTIVEYEGVYIFCGELRQISHSRRFLATGEYAGVAIFRGESRSFGVFWPGGGYTGVAMFRGESRSFGVFWPGDGYTGVAMFHSESRSFGVHAHSKCVVSNVLACSDDVGTLDVYRHFHRTKVWLTPTIDLTGISSPLI